MPRVPDYTPQVKPHQAPVTPQRLDSRGAFGPDTRSLGKDAQIISGVIETVAAQKDEYAAKKAYRQYAGALTNSLINPDTGMLYREGEAAMTVSKDYMDSAAKLKADFGRDLSERARVRYEMFAAQALTAGKEKVFKHERAQMTKMFDAEDTALMEQAVGEAVLYAGQSGGEHALQTINVTVDSFAKRHGIPSNSPQYENLRLGYTSKAHVGVIDAYLNQGHVESAQEWFTKYQDQISPEYQGKLQNAIRDKSDLIQTQTATDELSMKYPALTDQIAAARKKYSGPQEESVVKALKVRQDEKDAATKKDVDAEWNSVISDLLTQRDDPKAMDERILKVRHSANKAKAIALANSIRPKASDPTITSESLAEENKIRIEIDKGGYGSVDQVLADASVASIPRSRQQSLLNYFNQGGNKAKVTQTKLDGIVKRVAGKKIEKYPGMYDAVISQLEPGKTPNDQELSTMVARMIASGEAMGKGWFSTDEDMSYLEAVEQGYAKDWLPDVTSEERKAIIKVLDAADFKAKDDEALERAIRMTKKHSPDYLGIKWGK